MATKPSTVFLKRDHAISTSLLYHAFNIKNAEYRAAGYAGNNVIFKAEMCNSTKLCTNCQSRNVICKGKETQLFHLPAIGRKRCVLELLMHRISCKECESLYWPRLQFGTIKSVAGYFNVGWGLINQIHKDKLKQQNQNPEATGLWLPRYRIFQVAAIPSSQIQVLVYRMNHFYILMYGMLVLGTANTYIFSIRSASYFYGCNISFSESLQAERFAVPAG